MSEIDDPAASPLQPAATLRNTAAEVRNATSGDVVEDAGPSVNGRIPAPAPSDAANNSELPQEPGDEPAGTPGSQRHIELALGVIRLGVGAALMAAPRWAGRIWVGPGADGHGSLVFARALGARDVALGLRIITSVRAGQPAGPWIVAGFAADGADALAALIAAPHLTPARRILSPLVAGSVGAVGLLSYRMARNADGRTQPGDMFTGNLRLLRDIS